jgi:hypothetical protein
VTASASRRPRTARGYAAGRWEETVVLTTRATAIADEADELAAHALEVRSSEQKSSLRRDKCSLDVRAAPVGLGLAARGRLSETAQAMSTTEPKPNVEHLTLIQGVITRLAGNSFLLKGWAVTLVSALSAFAAKDADRTIAWIGCGAAVVFAVLDAMYLANEREFRELYKRALKGEAPAFSLAHEGVDRGKFLGALLSWSVLPIYLVAGAGAAIVGASA